MWYRVFAATDAHVVPAALLEFLQQQGHAVAGHFRGDEQGWFSAELVLADEGSPLELQRYLAGEPGIRSELNTWAAWLETQEGNPHRDDLMRRVIQSRQVFTLFRPPEVGEDQAVSELCRLIFLYLARETAGICQADEVGFMDAAGTVLLAERATAS